MGCGVGLLDVDFLVRPGHDDAVRTRVGVAGYASLGSAVGSIPQRVDPEGKPGTLGQAIVTKDLCRAMIGSAVKDVTAGSFLHRCCIC